jgi:hypothetical protein
MVDYRIVGTPVPLRRVFLRRPWRSNPLTESKNSYCSVWARERVIDKLLYLVFTWAH